MQHSVRTQVARFPGAYTKEAGAAFQRDGVVVVEDVIEPSRLVRVLELLCEHHPEHIGVGEPSDLRRLGERRFIAPIPFTPPLDCLDVIAGPIVLEWLAALLGDEFVFEAFGVISSLPGAGQQRIHFDGGLLYPNSGIDPLLPAPAVTMAIPLVDMDDTSGKTAFWLGSHRQCPDSYDVPFAAPEIKVGSVGIWDFRVHHSGLPNVGETVRPLLYVTACRPFWIDHKNFEPGKNAKLLVASETLDGLDEQARRRFVRAIPVN